MAESESLPTLLGSRVYVDVDTEVVPLKGRQAPAALELVDDVPEDFASEVCVKNTFIQEVSQLSPSLGAFYRERMVSTCPSKHIGRLSPPLLENSTGSQQHAVLLAPAEEVDELETKTPMGSPCGIQTPCSLRSPVGFPAAVGSTHFPPMRVTSGNCVQTTLSSAGVPLATVPPRTIHCGLDKAVRPVLSLADSIAAELSRMPAASRTADPAQSSMSANLLRGKAPAPPPPPNHSPRGVWRSARAGNALGRCEVAAPLNAAVSLPPPPPSYSPKVLLSLGSKDHGAGTCKPCAFLYTKGCDNGIACQFCHACAPEEIKRRRKQRLEQRRTARRVDDQALGEEESS